MCGFKWGKSLMFVHPGIRNSLGLWPSGSQYKQTISQSTQTSTPWLSRCTPLPLAGLARLPDRDRGFDRHCCSLSSLSGVGALHPGLYTWLRGFPGAHISRWPSEVSRLYIEAFDRHCHSLSCLSGVGSRL